MTLIGLCHIDELEDGQSVGLDPLGVGRDTIFVVRQSGTPYVYRNLCPHQGSTLPWRKNEFLNADGSRIVCAAHGAEFDIATGKCVRGAALGMSLGKVDVEIRGNGMICSSRVNLGA